MTTWSIVGNRDELRYHVSTEGRMISGAGQCRLAVEDTYISPEFHMALEKTNRRCMWTMSPCGSDDARSSLQVENEDSGSRKLVLAIEWPEVDYQAAERMLERVLLSDAVGYAIDLPIPMFQAGSKNPDAPMTIGAFFSGTSYPLPRGERPTPALTIGFSLVG